MTDCQRDGHYCPSCDASFRADYVQVIGALDAERYRKLRALLISPDHRWDLLTFVEHSKSQSVEEFDAVVDILPEAE